MYIIAQHKTKVDICILEIFKTILSKKYRWYADMAKFTN